MDIKTLLETYLSFHSGHGERYGAFSRQVGDAALMQSKAE